MNDRVQNVLNSILRRFETGDIPEAIAYSMFPFPDVPSAKWSLLNRTLMFLSGTMDARGIRQWNRVNRFVNKGSKCLFIPVPYIKKVEDNDDDKQVLIGFGTKAVFRVEDTDGQSLEYENIELPDVPLMERAEESSSVWKVKSSLRREAVLQFSRFVSVNLLTEITDSLVIIYHLTKAF